MEEEDYETCPDGKMTKLDDEEENTMLETPCPKRCCDRWKRRKHGTSDTKHKNGLQWCKPHIERNWVCLVCLT